MKPFVVRSWRQIAELAFGDESRSQLLPMRGLLRERSAEFERFWQEQRVAICRGGTKTMLNPRFGSADLQCQILRHEGAAQILVTFTAPPRTPGAAALSRLTGPE